MAGFSLPPPDAFLAVPGEPAVPWTRWITGFNTYIDALGFSEEQLPGKRKTALLVHLLGTEGQRVLGALGSPTTFAATVQLLTDHFSGKQRVLIRRYRLRKRHQRPGESIQTFVADLRELARACDYGGLHDQMIRDQLIEGTSCDKTREKLLMEPDGLTLTDAIKIALQVESALECSTLLTSPARQHNVLAQQLQHTDLSSHVSPPTDNSPADDSLPVQQMSRQRPPAGPRRNCGNCGSNSHDTRASQCPARGQVCKNCSKLNHFAKVCRSAPTNVAQQRKFPQPGSGYTEISNICSKRVSFKTCTVQLGEVGVPLILDTAAAASLLNLATYRKFFSHMPLGPPSTSLRGYANSTIEMVGTLHLPVRYGTTHLPSFLFHVARRGTNLLGLDLFIELGFSLMDNSGQSIMQVSPTMHQEWPALFDGLGCLTAFTHRPLVDPNVKPVIQPLRRLPLALREGVTAELTSLLEEGIIEPINAAPWISNLTIAHKKSGGLRICVDLRRVNDAVIPDKYPLPTAEELTTLFHGSVVFSKLDLRQGYLQVPLHPASRDLTAFVTHAGVFRYTRMPFGLNSAPSCFQKVMSTILAGVPGTAVYLDDIVVHGPDQATHDARLRRVFGALTTHHLTLNTEKCIFSVPAVDFIGFHISADGIAPLSSNVEAILRIPEPTSATQVSSFLGMTAYYLRFLPNYSQTTAPLRQLLKKEEAWDWSTQCTESFSTLKQQLTSPPVLAHFSLSCPTFVTCDASAAAVGAVLSQLHDGKERPIAFASRALTPTEQRYSVGEREALACVWACERWHMYLYGRRFTIRTDHQALTTVLSTSGSGHKPLRLHRWAERLRQYHYDLVFTPGRDNVVADLLSRSITAPAPSVPSYDEEPALIQVLYTPLQSVVTLEELQTESESDPLLSKLRTYIRNGWPSRIPDELKPFAKVKDELSCWADTCVSRGLCTVIPVTLRARVLSMAHEGHLGIVKLKQRCRELVWWPAIDRDIEHLVKDCSACLLSGKTGPPSTPPLQPLPWPSRPWEHVQLDICGEIHGRGVPHHQRFLVVVYDLHSKWPEVVPVGTVTSQVLIRILDRLFSQWGVVRTITTDNGPQMTSAEFSDFLASRSVKHIRTAFYHPQANGGVERFNATLKNGVRAHLAQGYAFDEALNQTLLHYRASQHSTTLVSPAFLMLGRELELPLHRLRAPGTTVPRPSLTQIRETVAARQRETKDRVDKKRRARPPSLQVSDWVRARRPQRPNKMASFWSQPRQIKRLLGPATFLLDDGSRWHASRLRKVPVPLSECEATAQAPSFPYAVGTDPGPPPAWVPPPAPPPAPALPPAEPRHVVVPDPRPVRARARPVTLQDFVTTYHA